MFPPWNTKKKWQQERNLPITRSKVLHKSTKVQTYRKFPRQLTYKLHPRNLSTPCRHADGKICRRLAKNHSIIETIQASSINDAYSTGVIEQRVTHGSKAIGENRNTRWYPDRQANGQTIFKRAYTRLNVHTWNWQCFVGERTFVTLIFKTLRRSSRWWNYNSRDISSIERTTSKRIRIVLSPGVELLFHIDDSVSYAAITARVPVLIIEGKKTFYEWLAKGGEQQEATLWQRNHFQMQAKRYSQFRPDIRVLGPPIITRTLIQEPDTSLSTRVFEFECRYSTTRIWFFPRDYSNITYEAFLIR